MSRGLLMSVIGVALLAMAGTAWADWDPGDGHKMHFPQYPNEYGWNVYSSDGAVLADDWQCSDSGFVNDIHFWGSWKNGDAGLINGFTITIYSNIPEDPPYFHSRPGTVLWGPYYISDFVDRHIVPTPEAWEGWFDPFAPEELWPDHDNFYQYNITNIQDIPSIPEPFFQIEGEIYWLAISADVESGPAPTYWGWKSSYMHFMDDAVFEGQGWEELFEPDLGPVYNNFSVTVDESGHVTDGWGDYAWDNQWFWYSDEDPGWWNIWFYDHPLSFERWKEVYVTGTVRTATGMGGLTGDITIAVNWSTPAWSEVGNPPGEPRRPPLNEDLDPMNPADYLMRYILYSGPVTDMPQDIGELGYSVSEYNPEWVSIDVQGSNFILDGAVSHQCVGSEPQSMDLAFVINGTTGDLTGACCWPDGTCTIETQVDCEDAAMINGTYMGDGSVCAGDADGDGVDDLCGNITLIGACCRPDGTCYVTSQGLCEAAGDTYKGDYTACLGDSDGDLVDDICEDPPGACCLDDGTCVLATAADCLAQSGDYLGDGSVCLGDGDMNGIDDACEEATDLKWFQPPDLSPEGMDVNGTYSDIVPYVLATDFQCTSPGPILEIHVFSSWYHDYLPLGDPRAVSFNLSIHTDIPDPDGDGPEYSMPGEMICFYPDYMDFDVRVYADDLVEGWLEPPDNFEPDGDHVCWEYIFHLPGDCLQEGTPYLPIVYWLDVQAFPHDAQAFWGWKTAVPPHWNDDAVWAIGEDGPAGAPNWNELYLAGTGYPYTPGDVDGDWDVDQDDVNYLQNWLMYGGPVPPYTVGGGFYPAADPNGDCFHDVTDITYLASYVNGMGPAPIYCPQYPPGTQGRSLDLALAIYGGDLEPTGACCYQDGSCADGMTAADCAASGGDYGGDGSTCAGTDNDANGVDDFCDGIVTLGACCYGDPAAPSCINTTQTVCEAAGGLAGTWYAGQDCATFTCPVTVGACCYEDGSCADGMTQADCETSGGEYGGDGSACAGADGDGNGVDDFCDDIVTLGACCYGPPAMVMQCVNTTQEICGQTLNGTWYAGEDCATFTCPEDEIMKWEQPPDLEPTGMDIYAMDDPIMGQFILADDFLCQSTGPITEIHIWGSWYNDIYPGDPSNITFTLSIHADIPAQQSPNGWSVPGPLLCLYEFGPGDFEVAEWPVMAYEGFMIPPQDWIPEGDHNCWEYIFHIPDEACIQHGTEQEPIVYWLDVQARPTVAPSPAAFGWKTTPLPFNWNDDAVFAVGAEPIEDPVAWTEMIYPQGHPWFPESINMAFSIYSVPGPDTCAGQMPGDYDSDGDIDINDLTDLTAYVNGLPGAYEATPKANGDFNGDCRVNNWDILDMTAHLFTGGPGPVDCTCLDPYGPCCIGIVGNANLDPAEQVTIGDISVMIDAKFITGTCDGILHCLTEADVNLTGMATPDCDDITIGDISTLIDHLFISGPTVLLLPDCY